MPDYKELYLSLFRASEQAVRILIEAQRACEELYISVQEAECQVIPITPESAKNADEA